MIAGSYRRCFSRVGIVLCLTLPVLAAETEKMPEDPRDQAAYLMRAGKTDEALSIYRLLAAQDPNNLDRKKELVWALWHAERYGDTAELALKLTQLLPQDIEMLNLLARARTMLGQKQAAISIYEKSLALNPDQLSVRLAIARIHIDLKDLETAASELARLKAQYPEESNIYADQARIALLQGAYEKALPLWDRAIQLAPENLLFKVHEIETLYHLDQMATAHDHLKALVANVKEPWPGKDRNDLWALLETVPALPGQRPEPLRPYAHPLGVDEVQIGLALGRLYSDLRDYEAASEILSDLEKTHKDNPEIYNRLARQYFLRGMYTEAAHAWASASRLSPEDISFQFDEARSLYYAGDHKTARAKLQDVAVRQSNYKWRAIDFLTDVAVVNNNLEDAQDYLEANLSDLQRPDEPRYMRLASIYAARGEITKCLATIDAFIAKNPRDGRALMFQADILVQHGRIAEAIELYKKVIQLNPSTLRAYFSLADAYNVIRNPREALANILKARAIDPTDPYLLIWQARYLYDVGDVKGSTQLLQNFLAKTPPPFVPAILYHGLSTQQEDPLLAYSVYLSTDVFEDQMRALTAVGYQSVSAAEMNDWVAGRKDLPVKKPILIAFDDARLDGIRNADPILEKYNLKATVFVPLVNVDKNLPGYTSWDQLRAYQKTGRWEFQLQGDLGRTRIPVDAEGRSGLYLINRQWLPSEGRVETLEEWTERIDADHDSGKQKMQKKLATTPVAFAYPEGDFGQLGLPSSPKAAEINLAETAKAYGSSYHEDSFGINIRTRDPQHLTLTDSRKDLTGVDLRQEIAEKNPFTLARITLLRQATWQGNIHHALSLLDELRQEPDLSPRVILTEEAQIHYSGRDLTRAEQLADQGSTFGDTPDLQSLKSSIDTQKRYIWTPSFLYQEDNQNRTNWVFNQTLSTWSLGDARWTLNQLYGAYQEKGTPDVNQNAIGVATAVRLGLFHTLDARVLGQFLSGQSDFTTYTGGAGLRSQWTDQWATNVEGGRALYDTAAALNEGIAERYARASISWLPEGPWEMKSKGKYSDLNDGNKFYDADFELNRQLIAETDFRVGFNVETEHMQDVRPEYYSPQHLIEYHAVFQLSAPIPPGFHLDLRYLPGYGKEDGAQGQFVNDVELSLPTPLGKQTMLTPEIWLSRTPIYHKDSYSVSLSHRF